LAVVCLGAGSASAAVIRVRPDGDDANSGASWALAKMTVQAAIDAAAEGDEIWVAAGTYAGHIKNKVFDEATNPVPVNVALFGGFAGTETARAQRNWTANMTVLDGEGGAAPPPPAVGSVVHISGGAGRTTRIDGFVITRGHAIGGGGVLIEGSGPTIAHNTILSNFASIGGGIGISNYDFVPPTIAQPVISDNTIYNNSAVEGGGGIAVIGAARLVSYNPAAPLIVRNVISQNTCVANGGGIGCWGHTAARIDGNSIVANAAAEDETSFACGGGGIYATSRDLDDQPISYAVCAPVIVNNAITANGGFLGAGIQCWDTDEEHGGIPVIANNTIASNNGIGIYWRASSPVMTNNLVVFNPWGLQQPVGAPTSPTISHNCVYGNSVRGKRTDYNGIADRTGLDGNISIDPLLANGRIGDIRIQPGSPCVDAGALSAAASDWKDIQGEDRVQGDGVDIGADESSGASWSVPTPVIHVRAEGDDAEDGTTWAKAKRTVGAAILRALLGGGGEVWVAEGTYVERNLLQAFIYLYGGFAGTEASRSERDVLAHPTILDGGGIPGVLTVKRAGYLTSAIDGFTIQNGGTFTDGVYPFVGDRHGGRGGGINCLQSSPAIENNVITRNSLGDPFNNADNPGYGGGLYVYMFFGPVRGNTFTENEVLNTFDGSGGAIYAHYSMPTIQGNTFTENHAPNGSAIFGTLSMPDIVGNAVENNSMYVFGSLYSGSAFGAIQLYMNEDFLIQGNLIRGNTAAVGAGIAATTNWAGKILNNLIVDNVAENPYHTGGMGGGMYLLVQDSATDDLVVAHNTIVGNTANLPGLPPPANEQGGGVALSLLPPNPPPPVAPPAKLVMAGNIIAFNSSGVWQNPVVPQPAPTLTGNDVYGSTSGAGLNYINISAGAADISADPGFVGAGTGDYRLQSASPCKDTGDNSAVPPVLTSDLDGNPRVVDGNGDASAVVDMGAYEYVAGPDATAPTVTITAPAGNAAFVTSLAVIDLGGTATDDVGITHVTWSNDRGGGGTCDGTGAWSAGGILLFIGQNVITVTAHDHASGGNTGTDTITIAYTLPVTISGYVRTPAGSGISGVIMDGLPSTPATDANGHYADTAVPAGWSGTVTPLRTGLSFTPASLEYANVTIDQVDQNYTGTGGQAQPAVTTGPVTGVTSTTARGSGDVISDGGEAVTVRGLCWGLTPNPTTAGSHSTDGAGTGTYASDLSGLMPGFTYYVRAYATNLVGTSYGNEVSFTTQTRNYAVPFHEAFAGPARPSDWAVHVDGTGVEDPWILGFSNDAGGSPNEMRSLYQLAQGSVRLVTPAIDTTGRTSLELRFRHLLKTWDVGGVTLSVQTSPDGLDWTEEAWSLITADADMGPASVRTTLSHNLDRGTTYVAFVMEGNLFNFEAWFLDDVTIAPPAPKKDLNGDGEEDILWRYGGPGGYNRAWFLGNSEPGAAPLSAADPRMIMNPALDPAQKTGGRGVPLSAPASPAGRAPGLSKAEQDVWSAMAGRPGRMAGFDDPRQAGRGAPGLSRPGLADPRQIEPVFAGPTGPLSAPVTLGGADILPVDDPAWEIAAVADFDKDTHADILWRHNGPGGENVIWLMDGTDGIGNAMILPVPDLDWRIVGTGDFNNDTHVDILWRYNGGAGTNLIWYMHGTEVVGSAELVGVSDLNWQIAGTGDFNKDGHIDVLWRYGGAGGFIVVWCLENAVIAGSVDLTPVADLNWQIAGTGDYDNDGNVDILWRYYGPGGYNYIWYMDGVTAIGGGTLIPVEDLAWRIVSR